MKTRLALARFERLRDAARPQTLRGDVITLDFHASEEGSPVASMPDECPNHGVYSDEQKNVAIGIVSDALTLLWEGRVPSGEGVREELRHVEIFGAIEGLPMAFVGLTFREPSKMYGKHLCYGTEVVLNQEPPEMARRIDASIREGLSSA